MQNLIHALKEWHVAVKALEQGDMIMLLRKGGIREASGRFSVAYNPVLLYPTYEHQQPRLLKAKSASQVTSVESGWHPSTVLIAAWADITDVFQISDAERIGALLPFHIWNEDFVRDRLKWKPSQPIDVLLLRVYRLNQPQSIAYSAAYGGCKSWIDLAEAIRLDGAPVLSDREYHAQTTTIRAIVDDGADLIEQRIVKKGLNSTSSGIMG